MKLASTDTVVKIANVPERSSRWGWGVGAVSPSILTRLASHLTRTISLTKEDSRFGSDFRRKL